MATGILFNIDRKVEKVANHSLVSDSEISKLSLYPAFNGEEGLDARIAAIEESIGDGTGDSLSARMTAAETALETLNGDTSTEGSVAKAVADTKATIDAYTVNGYAINTSLVLNGQDIALTGFTPEATSALTGITASSNVSAAVDAIDAVLAVVTGDANTTGSIAKALADAEAYTDSKVSALGSVFSYKGTKADLATLEALTTGNKVGDVWTVTNASGAAADQNLEYVCVAVNAETGAGTWERLGTNVDLSGYYTKTEIQGFTVNGKAVYTNPVLNGSDIALGSGYSAVTGSVLTGIATGSTLDTALDKVDEVLAGHDAALATLNGDATTAGSVAKAVADEAAIARAAEQANADAITVLNGDSSTEGSVAYAVKAEEDARKEEILSYTKDYTAFEVYPTDEVIPAGTVDDVTGLTYTREVPADMTARFILRLTTAPNDSDVIVDWGDDSRTVIKDGQYVENTDYIIDGNEYEIALSHEYTESNRFIVKFFGRNYFGFQKANKVSGSFGFGSNARSIVSRLLAPDLPLAKHISSICFIGACTDRLLKVDVPTYMITQGMWNMAGVFNSAVNLKIATGFRYFQGDIKSVNSFFTNCYSLEETDFIIPAYIRDSGGLASVFNQCTSLNIDVATIFSDQGFIGKTLNVNYMFAGCVNLTGTVPAEKLWENPNITWTSTRDTFKSCSAEIRAQVPTSWGGTNTEIQAKIDAGYYKNVPSQKLSYEFISTTTSKDLEDKMYIVRNAQFIGTLPTGNNIPKNVAIRVIVNEAASLLGGEIRLASGSTDTINGVSTAFALNDIMDVIFIYDSTNHDWVPVETRI